MSENSVNYIVEQSLAIIRLDDGKANALNHALIEGINISLDKAKDDAQSREEQCKKSRTISKKGTKQGA